MANDFSRLQQEVTEITDAGQALVALTDGLAEQLRAHANDPAQINSIADQLDTQGQAFADAVLRNTPADPGGGGGGEEPGGGGGETPVTGGRGKSGGRK